ncbi:MAG: purine-binding chemotaxis protein CheW, partial [Deltaproteobacteria bacterium]|nr:purine-binding chemotaxis protein CheW [Deltaproteobacteria bacterium]
MTELLEKQHELFQLVAFMVGEEEFSVDVLKIQEIVRMPHITRVPNTPEFVEGVVNLRGRVIPVIDLRKRFGLPAVERDEKARIMVIHSEGNTIGFIVDSVSEVLRLPASQVEPPPQGIAGDMSEYINGIGKLDNRLL